MNRKLASHVLATCLLAGMVVTLLPGAARAAFPGVNGLIAFTSDRDGNYEIYTIAPDGSETNLTNDSSSDDASPSWSPDGQTIAFVRGYELYAMDPTGGNQHKLANLPFGAQSPTWSPSGSQIAFSGYSPDGGEDIYVMNVDGTGLRNLTGTSQTTGGPSNEYTPDWSPDGHKILFVSDRESPVAGETAGTYVFDLRDDSQTKLTDDGGASWSPDGTKVVFLRGRNDGYSDIYTASLSDLAHPTKVTDDPSVNYYPRWSPDGTKVVFSSNRSDLSGNYELYVAPSDHVGAAVRLTNDAGADFAPDWQPVHPVSVIVNGSQAFGSTSPTFQHSETLPAGITVTGSLTCTELADGTAISSALPTGSYEIDTSSCGGLALSGPSQTAHVLEYAAGGVFTVTPPSHVDVLITGTQEFGSSTPAFDHSETAPAGIAVTGSAHCAGLTGGRGISDTLDAGTYTLDGGTCAGLSLAGANSSDFTIVYVGGAFTVSPAPVTVTANGSQSAGSSTPTFDHVENPPSGITTSGGLTCSKLADGANIASALPVGSYGIDATTCSGLTLSGTGSGNYTLAYVGGAFTVLDDGATLASFTADPNPGSCGANVRFDASTSTAGPGRSITSYAWDFGDGQSATGRIVSHSYAAFGSNPVVLTVRDNLSARGTLTLNVDQVNGEPIANAGGPYTIRNGAGVGLDGTASHDPNGVCGDSVTSYAWDVDDDGAFDDASGAAPSVTAADLAALGLGAGPHTIAVRVEDQHGALSSATTTLTIAPRPANDDFAEAVPLGPGTTNFDTSFATVETDEQVPGTLGFDPGSVWFSTSPGRGGLKLHAEANLPSHTSLRVAVYTGSSLTGLTLVKQGIVDYGASTRVLEITLPTREGVTYRIQVTGPTAFAVVPSLPGAGAGTLTPTFFPSPANDDFAEAVPLGPGTTNFDTSFATVQQDEPGNLPGDPGTVWFTSSPGLGDLSLHGEASFPAAQPLALSAYTGSAFGTSHLVGTGEAAASGADVVDVPSFATACGVTYSVQVRGPRAFEGGGFALGIGAGTVTRSFVPAPLVNDAFADAQPLTLGHTTLHDQWWTCATAQAGEPGHAGTAAAHSIWYRITVGSGRVSITSAGNRVAVYRGSALPSLTGVASGPAGTATFDTPGGTFLVAIDGGTGTAIDVDFIPGEVVTGTSLIVSTDTEIPADGATAADPIETKISRPVISSAPITIFEGQATTAPTAWSFFGWEVDISAPPLTPPVFYTITFTIDRSLFPGPLSALKVFRNGVEVPDCLVGSTGATP
ncbi:MAG TPA: PKD domain-containing protein, partial [Actinomycetota bacterium]|nr:PKD domain-containing protein [Actinomycetota bacterium]